MKRVLLMMLVVLLGTGAVVAQQKSVVGKWKISKIRTEGMDLNLEDPAAIKKMISEQISKESGAAPDSASLEMAYAMTTSLFEKMRIEFTADGRLLTRIVGPDGKANNEEAKYKVNPKTAILTTTSKKDGKEMVEEQKVSFEGEYLVLEKKGQEAETVILRRIKN